MSTHITVNGVPVEQLVKQEVAQEIQEVMQSENKVRLYRRATNRIHSSNGVPVRKWNLPDYMNWAREPLVICRKQVIPAVLKGPIAPSGESLIGVLELNRDSTKIKCHECGTFLAQIAHEHLHSHGITAREYKLRHGLNLSSPLCAPHVSQRRSAAATNISKERLDQIRKKRIHTRSSHAHKGFSSPENLNNHENCPMQIPQKLRVLAGELGRTPTLTEMNERYGKMQAAIYALFGSYNELLRQEGLIVNKMHGYGREELLERLRKFSEVCRRQPNWGDFGAKGLLPSTRTYGRKFGSWQNAVGLCM